MSASIDTLGSLADLKSLEQQLRLPTETLLVDAVLVAFMLHGLAVPG